MLFSAEERKASSLRSCRTVLKGARGVDWLGWVRLSTASAAAVFCWPCKTSWGSHMDACPLSEGTIQGRTIIVIAEVAIVILGRVERGEGERGRWSECGPTVRPLQSGRRRCKSSLISSRWCASFFFFRACPIIVLLLFWSVWCALWLCAIEFRF